MSRTTCKKLRQILNDQGKLNRLSHYRGSARNFTASQIDIELNTHNTIKDIYPELKQLVEKLALSQGNMTYYASVVQHQPLYKLRRYSKWQGLLYLVCYLYFRYQQTSDRLVTCFCYLIQKHEEAAKAYAKQKIAEDLEKVRDKLRYAGRLLRFFVDDQAFSDTLLFSDVRKEAFKLIPREELQMVSDHLDEKDLDKRRYQWEYTDKSHSRIKQLRKLFLALDIECEEMHSVLHQQMLSARRQLLQEGKITSPDHRIILKKDRIYLLHNAQEDPRRFEYYLYYRVYRMLDANRMFVTESAASKSLEDDLISRDHWKNKGDFLDRAGLPKLDTPIRETLKAFSNRLCFRMKQVGDNINTGMNEFVKCSPRSGELVWSVAHKRWKEDDENPVYSQLQHMSIIDIMRYVNQHTGFLDEFKRISARKKSVKARDEDLLAAIFANGTGFGISGMSRASDRSVGTLRTVEEGYMHLESTRKVCDRITNGIARLPIFNYYTINENAPFGSIDGQKLMCRINTFKARFSAKYFRKGKGISALTLVCNHVPVEAGVISPNEYEGHYAFDLLFNNSSEVQPGTLATDTHGVNNVNFAILDIFGYQFAPRFARFKHAFFDEFEVTPGDAVELQLKKPINGRLIEQEWDEIQRIMCSLSRKTATQSTIVKKLSSNKRSSRTLAALHEYDRMVKCLYLLDYVDNKTLRQFVQQALNRGEAYHQLRKAISSVNGNGFRGGSDYQIAQWNDCSRIIANCIIYYNCALLSGLVTSFEEKGNKEVIDMLSRLSPVAWRHILLSGHYNFAEERPGIDVAELLKNVDPLAENVVTYEAA